GEWCAVFIGPQRRVGRWPDDERRFDRDEGWSDQSGRDLREAVASPLYANGADSGRASGSPPAQTHGSAVTTRAIGYQCGPNAGPAFQVATSPNVAKTRPIAPRTMT